MSVYDRSIHRSSVLRTLQSKALFCRGSALADKVSGVGPKVLMFRILLRTVFHFFQSKFFHAQVPRFFGLCVLIFLRSKCCLHKRLFFFRPTFFRELSLGLFGFYLFAMGKFSCSYFCLCGMKPCQIRMYFE